MGTLRLGVLPLVIEVMSPVPGWVSMGRGPAWREGPRTEPKEQGGEAVRDEAARARDPRARGQGVGGNGPPQGMLQSGQAWRDRTTQS